MSKKTFKISLFWQELKRRKVIHVIVVYATSALVIIELVNNITEPLRLPEWTPTLVIVLLSIGFPLAIIFSWIYDVSSKGITKTEKAIPEYQISSSENSIAVLPFQDMSPARDQEYFCDGIAEEIINALSNVSSMKVIARTSAFAFKNQNLDMREIAQRLNVGTLLEGSIRKDGNRLRITVQLIRAEDNSHIWSERFDRNLEDIFAIQDEISMAVVDKLKIKLLGDERSAILKRSTDSFEVYNLYLKATSNIQLVASEGFEKAMEYIGLALQKDPQFAPGYTALGRIYQLGAFFGNMPPNTGYPKAKEYAVKALELDNTSPEAYYIMGMVGTFYDWDWKAAEQNFKYALKLNPNLGWVHVGYSFLLSIMGRYPEAISQAKQAVELDPLSGYFSTILGNAYIYASQFDKAINQLKENISTFPNYYFGHWILGTAYRGASKMDEAIQEYRKAIELSNGIPVVVAFLASALYENGNKEESGRLINSLELRAEKEYVPACSFLIYYLLDGDHEQASRWVERAIREHDGYLPLNLTYPVKEYQVPREPGYIALMKKLGAEWYFQYARM